MAKCALHEILRRLGLIPSRRGRKLRIEGGLKSVGGPALYQDSNGRVIGGLHMQHEGVASIDCLDPHNALRREYRRYVINLVKHCPYPAAPLR